SVELVPQQEHQHTSSTHQWNQQYGSRHGIEEDILQEPVATNPAHISRNQPSLGTFLNRPLCRQDDETVAKLRVMATGSRRYPYYACVHHSMDQLESTIRKSPLESHLTSITEDYPRRDSANSSGGSTLAECNLVPYDPTFSSAPPKQSRPHLPTRHIPYYRTTGL
ncbi:hypothetical protein, partial, partial [Parasitella parasitica]